MGIPFSLSFQHLVERVAVPLHDLFSSSSRGMDEEHELLWDCYASGQMSDHDLEREISADPAFAAFVRTREHRFH